MTILNEIKVGQRITVTVGVQGDIEGDYSGIVTLINAEKTRIQLKEVVFCPTKKKFTGVKQFYLPEIVSVKVNELSESTEQPASASNPTVEAIKFELSPDDAETIQRLITDQCTIRTGDDELDKALDDIFHYQFVGLCGDGVGDGKYGKITIIVCSTPHKIYRFNMDTIGSINDRFKEWFESDDHIKVIHGASSLTENLLECHGINLKGIFDTMAAHRMLPHITLSPELTAKLDSGTETSINKIAILLKFHDFLAAQLLNDLYESSQRNLNYCRNKDVLEVQAIYRSDKSMAHETSLFECT